jgi:hypothetical protein
MRRHRERRSGLAGSSHGCLDDQLVNLQPHGCGSCLTFLRVYSICAVLRLDMLCRI